MGVVARERVKGAGIWWVFVTHKGQRRAKRVGDRKAAEVVASQFRTRLALEIQSPLDPVPEHGFSLPADMRRLVYAWRRGKQVLYVGQSKMGFAHIPNIHPWKHALDKIHAAWGSSWFTSEHFEWLTETRDQSDLEDLEKEWETPAAPQSVQMSPSKGGGS